MSTELGCDTQFSAFTLVFGSTSEIPPPIGKLGFELRNPFE
ncbi:hypothetical protein [Gordonia sp. KTR9]|nr:hypothetical protein [Gordonia sp. KTR9]